jgi:hypothetical protein
VRFQYVNTNGEVITGITGGNAGSGITTAVTATVSYNTNLNTQALGLTGSNALTADIYVIFNDGIGDKTLKITANVKDCACCGALVANGKFQEFMCWNLGADYTADPFTISSQIFGARYYWGEKKPYLTQAEDATFNGTEVFGANTIVDWSDFIKTAKDPCPAGYRVPSADLWNEVKNNNTRTLVGPWVGSISAFTSYAKFGNSLLLPANGQRTGGYSFSTTSIRGTLAGYWTSSINPAPNTVNAMLIIKSSNLIDPYFARGINNQSLGIRCVKE